jgi:hypothetical protein
MPDYNSLKNHCDQASRIGATLVDDFLMHYAAAKDNVAREFDLRIAPYKHLTQGETEWTNRIKAQYIIHRVFKSEGLLGKYLNHAEVKRRSLEERQFLQDQLQVPWRFSFSIIISNPAPDFYEMEDVFTETRFLLYSKSTTLFLSEQPVMLWFNLIGFNGECWQTFGPVSAYETFDSDDIFFFATEVSPRIEDANSLMADVERNPVPYMMLIHGGRMPNTFHNKEEVLMVFSEENLESIDIEVLKKKHFKVEYNSDVFRITLKAWNMYPHLTAAYFDEKEKVLAISSMTERGFFKLAKKLIDSGLDIFPEPQIRIHLAMLSTCEDILNKEIEFNPYEDLFIQESSPEEEAEFDKINAFMQSVLPAINEGKIPNIEALARAAGIDESTAKKLVNDLVKKIERMKKR